MCEGPKLGRNLVHPRNDKRLVCLQCDQPSDERNKVWLERYAQMSFYKTLLGI